MCGALRLAQNQERNGWCMSRRMRAPTRWWPHAQEKGCWPLQCGIIEMIAKFLLCDPVLISHKLFTGFQKHIINYLIYTLNLLVSTWAACAIFFLIGASVSQFATAQILIAVSFIFQMVRYSIKMFENAKSHISIPSFGLYIMQYVLCVLLWGCCQVTLSTCIQNCWLPPNLVTRFPIFHLFGHSFILARN